MSENLQTVLMLSYTSFLQKYYLTLPNEIALQTGAKVNVLISEYWKELWSKKRIFPEELPNAQFELLKSKTFFAGNLHFSVFREHVTRLIKESQPDIIDMENEPFNFGSLQIAWLRDRYSPKSKLIFTLPKIS